MCFGDGAHVRMGHLCLWDLGRYHELFSSDFFFIRNSFCCEVRIKQVAAKSVIAFDVSLEPK